MVLRLVYSSEYKAINVESHSKLDQVREILASAQKHNEVNDVTGFLIFDGVTFLQILEGEREQVIATYDRIKKDKRHDKLFLFEMTDIPERQFAGWRMGGGMRSLDAQEIYLRHGIGQYIQPDVLTADRIVRLALDLKAFEGG